MRTYFCLPHVCGTDEPPVVPAVPDVPADLAEPVDPPKPVVPLPFPDIPAGQTLDYSDLAGLPTIPDLGPEYTKHDTNAGYKAVAFETLTAGQWLSVANNMNLYRGMYFDDVSKNSSLPVLLPKNQSLFPIFQRSQKSVVYKSSVASQSKTSDRSAISAKGASAKLATPWVSAAASYKSETEDRTVLKSESLSTTVAYELPMGKFDFSAGLRKYIDYDDNPTKDALFQVNPDLVLRFTALLDDFDKLKKGGTGVDKFSLTKDVILFFKDFGDVFALSASFGLSFYKTATVTASSEQNLSKYSDNWAGAVDASFSVKAGGSATYDEAKTYENAGVKKVQSSGWEVFAGSIPVDQDNPFSLVDDRQNPNSWSATEYSEYISVVELLPPNLQDRMKKYDNDIQYMSIFHNLDTNRLFQFEVGWQKNLSSSFVKSVGTQMVIDRDGDSKNGPVIYLDSARFLNVVFTPQGESGDGQYTISKKFNPDTFLSSRGVGITFSFFNKTPNTMDTKNETFFIVPYRPTQGNAPSEMRYAIRNVATREYMYARNNPFPDSKPNNSFWPL